mmetsp:Transcript_15314/g.49104  ORF Transcript_15314/g.49104 Transcript_15314/m.49104 type:complete len:415 (+) Transcript_15314:3-1247(+)
MARSCAWQRPQSHAPRSKAFSGRRGGAGSDGQFAGASSATAVAVRARALCGAPSQSSALKACGPLHAHVRQQSSASQAPSPRADFPALPAFADQALRGFGQVVFCNSPASGALIGAGLLWADPCLAALAATGCVSATAAARVAGFDAGAVSAGLFGYNGALVGCAFAVFLGFEYMEPAMAATAAGGAASALVTSRLGKVLTAVPQWTLAFNATAISALLWARRSSVPSAAPAAAESAAPARGAAEMSLGEWCSSSLTGVSQIFVVNDAISGALMLAGIVAYSAGAAAATLLGSGLGAGAGAAWGADAEDVKAGLWGFNPALTSLAVSIFFVPLGFSPLVLVCGGAVASAAATVVISGTFREALEVPSCTLPFCLVASGCYLLAGRLPGLALAAAPHSPEANLRAFRAAAAASAR